GGTTGGESVKGRTKGGERKTGDAASPETKPETEAESLEAKAKPEDRWHSAQSLNASLGSTLSRVELMVASGSDWVWARRLMASLFWLSWISLVSGALLVIVRSPECNPPPGSTGGTTGIKHQLHHIKMLHMRAIIIGPIHQYKPDDRNKTNLKSIDMIYGNIQNFRYLIKSANTRGIIFFLLFVGDNIHNVFLQFGNPYKGHIVSLVSENLGKLIALIMFTLPGTPIIYYGDEIGLEDYQVITTLPTLVTSQLGFFKKELESLKYGSFRKVLNETTYFAYTRQWNAHGILAVLNFGDTIHVDFTASGLPLTSLLILSSSLGLQCQIVNMKNLAIPSLEAYMLKYYVLD
uniref:4F2 cell-surface antigen heavy chain-like n=1 Tax=Callorhinchus milii TaxID=7868 RepID=A0A4W3H259_CALMI